MQFKDSCMIRYLFQYWICKLSNLVGQICPSDNIITITKVIIGKTYWAGTMVSSFIPMSSFNPQNNAANKCGHLKFSSQEIDSRPTLMLYCSYGLVHHRRVYLMCHLGPLPLGLNLATQPRFPVEVSMFSSSSSTSQ